MTLAEEIIKNYESLKANHSAFSQSLEDISFYVYPEYDKRVPLESANNDAATRPVSSHATEVADVFAGHFFSNTINTSQRWFSLKPRTLLDKDLTRNFKETLEEVTTAVLDAIQASNFNEAFGEMCRYYGAYGTGCLSIEWDSKEEKLNFRSFPISQGLQLTEDPNGIVNGIYRPVTFTTKQVVEKFGEDNLPKSVAACYAKPEDHYKLHEFIYCVTKNPNANKTRKDNLSMPWRSVYVHVKDKHVVEQSGFRTFPFACPRLLKKPGMAHGEGFGHRALPSIRELNRAEAEFMDSYSLEARPPIWFPDEEAANRSQYKPSAINFYNPTAGGSPFQPKLGGNISALEFRINQLEERIKRHFFVDVFLALTAREQGQKTAREVEEISREKLSTLGPIVSRFHSEGAAVIVKRIIDILIYDAGLLEPLPIDFKVSYTSRIDSLMAAIEADNVLQGAAEAAQLIELDANLPKLKHVFKSEEAAISILERRNVDLKFIPTKHERAKIMQAENAATEAAQVQEVMKEHVGKVDPNKAPDPGSAAESLMNQYG